jgi:hypothetical protein
VRLWISDTQEAFVRGIAAEFPGVPHRSCATHFVRDVAKPVLDADSRAKVQMRRKVRGVRTLEREVCAAQRGAERAALAEAQSEAVRSNPAPADETTQEVALDYCAAVRGILHDDQGGPLHPPGLRMAERPWRTCTAPSSGIWRRKKGAYTRASRALSGRH